MRHALLFSLLVGAATLARAQAPAPPGAGYPARPIKLIVGYSAGGSNDILARLVARRLQESMGQPVFVENRPSTAGVVGAIATAKAAPDGYTLMVGAMGQFAFNAALYRNLAYSPTADFVPISTIATFPLVVCVKADSAIRSMKDLVRVTRENPERSNYGSSTSSFRLATELLKETTGIQAEHVPYKGSADSMNAIASGEVTFGLLDTGPAAGGINGKLLRGLAISSSQRLAAFPDVPTLKEQGIDQETVLWTGLFAPAGTPPAIVHRLETEVAKAIAHPESVRSMQQIGLEPSASTSAAFTRQVAEEVRFWSALARQKKIPLE